MIRKLIYSLGIIALMGALLTPRVEAGLVLTLFDVSTNTTVTVLDNDNDGLVTFAGNVGNWTFNASIGTSHLIFNAPIMDLASVNAVTNHAGTLIVTLTDDTFPSFPAGGMLEGLFTGQVINGSGSMSVTGSIIDSGNNTLATVSDGPVTSTFSGIPQFDSYTPFVGNYTLEITATFVSDGTFSSSTDFSLETHAVPVPAGIVLLGMGAPLLGAGYWMRRRRVAVA